MGEHPVDRLAQGQNGKTGGSGQCAFQPEQASRQQEKQKYAGQIRQQQTEVHGRGRLSEDQHEQGVEYADTGYLHGVGVREGGSAFQDQLSQIGEFAFVPFHRYRKQPDADEEHGYQRQCQQQVEQILREFFGEHVWLPCD